MGDNAQEERGAGADVEGDGAMTQEWRNEWRVYSGMRTAGRWAVWAAVAFVSLHVVAAVIQRVVVS